MDDDEVSGLILFNIFLIVISFALAPFGLLLLVIIGFAQVLIALILKCYNKTGKVKKEINIYY